jgi:hypothetical protein
MNTTTLNRIRAHSPCKSGWEKLLRGLGKTRADDEPLAYSRILQICGLADALWTLRAEPQHAALRRKMAVRFAREVQHLMCQESVGVLDAAERHAAGMATDAELAKARAVAWDAASAGAWTWARASAWAAASSADSASAADSTADSAHNAAAAAAWAVELAADAVHEAVDAEARARAWARAQDNAKARQAAIYLESLS